MRISDWSSDVCSSDLAGDRVVHFGRLVPGNHPRADRGGGAWHPRYLAGPEGKCYCRPSNSRWHGLGDRKSVVEGKSVSVRVDLGGRRIIKKKKNTNFTSILLHK